MSRKAARELAFKIVFAANFQDKEDSLEDITASLLKENDNTNDISDEDIKYIKEVSHGVYNNVVELDEKIKCHLKGWTMDRICKTDLAILRLAIYEIVYREDIPDKVSVNEAVELAKMFSEDNSSAFINGVLAGIISKKTEDINE